MADNGSGVFNIDSTGQPVVAATLITAATHNALTTDLAAGLSNRICKDGQTTVTADIPFNNKKITGLAAATTRTDAASLATIQDGTGTYVGTVGGTADVITLTASPAITAYAAGQTFRFIASGANTTNVTVAINGLAAKAITKNGTTALVANDILSAMMVQMTYDGTRFILGTHLTADVATLAGAQTLTNKTITAPTFSGTAAGSLTNLALTTPAFTGASTGTWTIGTGATLTADPTTALQPATKQYVDGRQYPPMHIQGLTYANNGADATNDLDIAAGSCADATGVESMLGTAKTKQSDVAWAVGSAAGMLDTGAVGNSDYYIWAIKRSDTDVVDYLSSLSSTAPTMPANYDFKRLIGWFKRVAGVNVPMHIYETEGGGIHLGWDSPTLDINLSNTLTTSRRTDPVKVPLNFSVVADLNVVINDTSGVHHAIIYCPDQEDLVPSVTAGPLINFGIQVSAGSSSGGQLLVRTSATGTIAARAITASIDLYAVSTTGFTWARRN